MPEVSIYFVTLGILIYKFVIMYNRIIYSVSLSYAEFTTQIVEVRPAVFHKTAGLFLSTKFPIIYINLEKGKRFL